jgi:hypothetical protein
VLIEKGFKNTDVLTSEPNVTVTKCCNDAGQFLPPVLIFKGLNKKQVLADILAQKSVVYINWESSSLSTHVFSKSFRGQFLKHSNSGQVTRLSDERRAQCNFPLVLRTAVQNNVLSFLYRVTVLALYSSRISVLLGP